MKRIISHVALFGGGPFVALMSVCGYLGGMGESAACLFLCLATAIAIGIISFLGLLGFGWIGAFGYRGLRTLATASRR
jgi:hypothetical protein